MLKVLKNVETAKCHTAFLADLYKLIQSKMLTSVNNMVVLVNTQKTFLILKVF